jgi:hypothetical protein
MNELEGMQKETTLFNLRNYGGCGLRGLRKDTKIRSCGKLPGCDAV